LNKLFKNTYYFKKISISDLLEMVFMISESLVEPAGVFSKSGRQI